MTIELFLGLITIIALVCLPIAPIWLLLLEQKFDLKHKYLQKGKDENDEKID